MSGAIAERWFFERLVNMTYSPKNKVGFCNQQPQQPQVIIITLTSSSWSLITGSLFVAPERWSNSAAEVLHQEVPRSLLLHQGHEKKG